jgi:NAD(P)-dependent dehydrogenase (short-subunit alcohol dehydrogenase family)
MADDTHQGKVALITGGGRGFGKAFGLALAARGAHVVLADIDGAAAASAAAEIADQGGSASGTVCDVADESGVAAMVDAVAAEHGGIDILVNNAGIAGGPRRSTVDGFEAHFGVNYLGHFALTGLLLPALLARPGARVVSVTSSVAAQGRIDFTDLGSERRYRFIAAYSRSKLANLMFAVELDRRAKAAGLTLVSTAVNPGIVTTSLLSQKRGQWGRGARPAELAVAALQRLLGQPPGDGCRTSLYAATAAELRGGEYIVPGGRGHRRGHPVAAPPPPRALDYETARRLWEASAALTEVTFTALDR